ncbi:wsv372 [White spot syndrome virus]|uniref:Wsv372 n=4 Tax=White spot syndrome virus TaxID=342409 RepID=Q8VAM9_WSSVS|nr:wsv372 [Shrimp white spot syndrome virus]AFX59749.1 wsv372 [White spot syndrome virus]AAL33374.1 wsv372 [Shrimp white spot syndrome virus]AAL89299.1 WSSV431 [Shrimp white spot syndrome virus]AWQ60497.1 wsv372 [Shrimp white spot syndrome virus]AWQ60942.1 wsv372 [Shrimp white spot syndrome virus]
MAELEGDAFSASASPSFSMSLSIFLISASSSAKMSFMAYFPKQRDCRRERMVAFLLSSTIARMVLATLR